MDGRALQRKGKSKDTRKDFGQWKFMKNKGSLVIVLVNVF